MTPPTTDPDGGASRPAFWDETYAAKDESRRSWSQDVPAESLFFIDEVHVSLDGAIIDVGGGASRLVDQLLARNFSDVTVLDISAKAIDEARHRVNDGRVHWIADDVTTWVPTRTYALWHDRAVFHFLVAPNDQAAYVERATSAVEAGGHLLLATFSHSGPATCSGLPVQRWSAREITDRFDEGFSVVEGALRDHVTPWGEVQPFTWVLMQRREA
jgi:SAM-dependent methyltransferase